MRVDNIPSPPSSPPPTPAINSFSTNLWISEVNLTVSFHFRFTWDRRSHMSLLMWTILKHWNLLQYCFVWTCFFRQESAPNRVKCPLHWKSSVMLDRHLFTYYLKTGCLNTPVIDILAEQFNCCGTVRCIFEMPPHHGIPVAPHFPVGFWIKNCPGPQFFFFWKVKSHFWIENHCPKII